MNSGHDEQDYLDSFLESAFAAGDGVHADGAGYAEMARLIEAWPAWRAWFDGN